MKRLPLAVLALSIVCGGCGIPTSGVPKPIAAASVPFTLLGTEPVGAQPPSLGPATLVYYVRQDRLAPVTRHIPGSNVPAASVRMILSGPTASEANDGLASDVPARTRLVSLDVTGRVATVDLSKEFGTIGGSDQVLAVAQIVYTVTASRYIDAVSFAINGRRIEVPDGSGSLSVTPRARVDYRALAPR